MLQVTGPTEIVILLVFDIRIADTRGMVNLCIPAAAIEAVGEAFAQGWQRTRRQPSADEESWLHANLGRVQLPVTALLETTTAGARSDCAAARRRAVARTWRHAAD